MADRYRRTVITVADGATARVQILTATDSWLPQIRSIGKPRTAGVLLRLYHNDELVAAIDAPREAGYADFIPFEQPMAADDRLDAEIVNDTGAPISFAVITHYVEAAPGR